MGVSHTGPAFHGPGSHAPAYAPVTADDPQLLAGYRPTARIGTTALGRVYLAQAPGEREVVLTVVHAALAARDGFGARFHREAQAAARIRALGAPRVLASGNEGSTYWIASAYVPAPTLLAAVTAGGPLPTGVVLRLVAGLADALQVMHHEGVVHGDLRPAHVLLAADGPKTVQYGMAGLADVAADARGGDGGGDEGGGSGDGRGDGGGEPPALLAPEQVAGRPAVPATDVFALGQLAAYASIGRPPFDDPSRVGQEEPDLNELPGELREIVIRCLIKDPALRPSLAQVVTMCRQAAPRPVPAEPGPAGAGPARTGAAEAAAPPPTPATVVPLGAVPQGAFAPGAVPPGAVPPGAAPPGVAPQGAIPPGAVPPGAVPPVALPPPAAAPGGMAHGPFGWVPRPPAAVRRRKGAGVAVAGLALALVAGFGLARGMSGGGGSDGRPGLGAVAPTSTAPSGPTGDPAPGATPGPGDTTPPDQDRPTAPDDSAGGETYRGIRLPAGSALFLQDRPPVVRPGPDAGAFGFTADARAFASDEHRGSLAVLPGDLPATPDACRTAAGPQVASIPRQAVEDTGARVCVHGVDGTLAVVTLRQVTPVEDPDAYAVVDVTVWRVLDRSAESDQNGLVPARAGAAVARISSQIRRTL